MAMEYCNMTVAELIERLRNVTPDSEAEVVTDTPAYGTITDVQWDAFHSIVVINVEPLP